MDSEVRSTNERNKERMTEAVEWMQYTAKSCWWSARQGGLLILRVPSSRLSWSITVKKELSVVYVLPHPIPSALPRTQNRRGLSQSGDLRERDPVALDHYALPAGRPRAMSFSQIEKLNIEPTWSSSIGILASAECWPLTQA